MAIASKFRHFTFLLGVAVVLSCTEAPVDLGKAKELFEASDWEARSESLALFERALKSPANIGPIGSFIDSHLNPLDYHLSRLLSLKTAQGGLSEKAVDMIIENRLSQEANTEPNLSDYATPVLRALLKNAPDIAQAKALKVITDIYNARTNHRLKDPNRFLNGMAMLVSLVQEGYGHGLARAIANNKDFTSLIPPTAQTWKFHRMQTQLWIELLKKEPNNSVYQSEALLFSQAAIEKPFKSDWTFQEDGYRLAYEGIKASALKKADFNLDKVGNTNVDSIVDAILNLQ